VVDVVAPVVAAVNNVEEGENVGEVGFDCFSACVAGASVEHIDDIEGDKDTGLVGGIANVTRGEYAC